MSGNSHPLAKIEIGDQRCKT